jgi:MSHA biogenesis protein MshI
VEIRLFGLPKRQARDNGRIGLFFARDHIAVAIVNREHDQLLLERCEILPVDPAGGPGAPAAALRAAQLPQLPVSCVLGPEDYELALVEAPDVPPAELRAAMRWRLKDAIDFKVEDAVIDVFNVPPPSRGGQGRMMYAVAARRSAVERSAAALQSMPAFDVVDVPELCLGNLAAAVPEAAHGVALLHLGEKAGMVVLLRGRTFYFARKMDLKVASRAAGVHDLDGQLDSPNILLELQRSLDYYERQFDQPPITRLVISPAGPLADALAENLRRDTGFDVSVLDLNTVLNCSTPVAIATQNACLLAVGAALRRERRSL